MGLRRVEEGRTCRAVQLRGAGQTRTERDTTAQRAAEKDRAELSRAQWNRVVQGRIGQIIASRTELVAVFRIK